MRVIAFHGRIFRAEFMERALPQIEGKREHVCFAAKRQLRGFARLDVLRFEAFPRLAGAPLLRQFKGVFQTAVHAAARVHRLLNRDFMRCALEHKTARAGVKPLVVLAHDDKINVLRPLVLERTVNGAIKFHGAEVDVLLQLETEAQQNAFFQDARLDLRMADCAQKNHLEPAEFVHGAVGQHFARFQITVAAEIVVMPVEFETEFFGGRFGNLERLAGHFRSRPIAANYSNVISFHALFLPAIETRTAMLAFWRVVTTEFCIRHSPVEIQNSRDGIALQNRHAALLLR